MKLFSKGCTKLLINVACGFVDFNRGDVIVKINRGYDHDLFTNYLNLFHVENFVVFHRGDLLDIP